MASNGAAPPLCAGDYPVEALEAFAGLDAPPAECEACLCDDAEDVECLPPKVQLYDNSNCSGAPDLEFELEPHDVCKVFGDFGSGSVSAESDPVLMNPGTGSCAASGGDVTLPEWGWDAQVRACSSGGNAGSCGAGTCVPNPVGEFAGGLCVYREGDRECPNDAYPNRTLVYLSAEDQRGCSACGCGDPQDVACEALIELHYNNSCSNLRDQIDNPGSECVVMPNSGYAPRSGKMVVYGTSGGDCPPTGGEAAGEVVPQGATTVCCTQ
jgi:hypothetical protein